MSQQTTHKHQATVLPKYRGYLGPGVFPVSTNTSTDTHNGAAVFSPWASVSLLPPGRTSKRRRRGGKRCRT